MFMSSDLVSDLDLEMNSDPDLNPTRPNVLESDGTRVTDSQLCFLEWNTVKRFKFVKS
jgi:hypothetical protein